MLPSPTRRDFLQILLGGAAVAPFARMAAAQGTGQLAVTPLAPTLRLVSGAGGNVVVMNGPDGLLLVNGGAAAHSTRLLAAIAEGTGGKRIQTLFNTDWHPAHTGSNEAVATAGGQILAHENTKQYLGADLSVEWQKRSYKALPARALPTKTFYTTGKMTFAGERVEYGHLGQAHTDGDIYVSFPDANVLVAGDVLSVGKYPIADYTTGGWLGGLATATKTLLDLSNAATRVIPGDGPVQTRADLQAQYDMLVKMRDTLGKMMRQGLSAEEMLAAGATKEFDAKWGSPDLFVSTTYRGLWLHVRELGGVV
jgi:cyclase